MIAGKHAISSAGVVLLTTAALVAPTHAMSRARSRGHLVPHATAVHHPDFNHDGYADLVVSAQGDDIAGTDQAGGLWVLYGGAHGANTGNRHQYFTEASIGRGASSGLKDFFGFAYDSGDFNRDGYDDLAVTALGKTVNGQTRAGAVVVLYGSGFGLITGNAQYFTEATTGMNATPHQDDVFGAAVAAGDFNHDGYDDLAIGANGKIINGHTEAGAVFELFGTAHGLSHTAPLLPKEFDETTPGLHGGANTFDDFGWALHAGDFNGDGYADLAVGAPYKNVNGKNNAGVVQVLPGSAHGLTGTGAQTWSEDTSGVPDSSENGDEWGIVLGAMDINGDGRSDLLIGAPDEDQGATSNVGAATVLMGSAHGLTTSGALFYLLSNTTTGQTPAATDYFGSSFAPFDFDGDGRPDLAIGVEARTIGSVMHAGEVVVLHNVGGRLSRSGGFTVAFQPHTNGYAGSLVRGGDWSGNGHDDLGIGAPYTTVSGLESAGAMQVLYGSASGVGNGTLFTATTLGGTLYQFGYVGGYDF